MDLTSVFLGRVFNREASGERKLPRTTSDDPPFKMNNDYSSLVNYYKGMEEDDEQGKFDWRKPIPHIKRHVSNENQMSLYDDADTSRKLRELFDESHTLTAEDEIAIMYSYHEGETYLDRYNNQLTVVSITDNYAVVNLNKHLAKFKNSEVKFNRVDFLHRMKFNPGLIMNTYD